MGDVVIEHTALYIDGGWVVADGLGTIDVVSPATEEVVGRVPAPGPLDVQRAVAAARRAFDRGDWSSASPGDRADALDRIATGIGERVEPFAQTITTEMGSPITTSRTRQVPPAVGIARYYASLARSAPTEEVRPGPYGDSLVVRDPVGVVAAIIPWNVPLTMAIVKLAPALAAGCTVVLKPAPQAPLDTYLLAEVVDAAGLPPGVVNVVAGDGAVGEQLVRSADVDKVAFTGSSAAGRKVMSMCADRVSRVGLELGGKSAAIVLDDADLDDTVARLLPMSLMYSGQACHAQTRLLVPRALHDAFVERLVDRVGAMAMGDPADPATELGPLVSQTQRDRVLRLLQGAVADGARAVIGGGRPQHLARGWFVEPTVFVGVHNAMPIARDEVFGPVLCVIPYDDVGQAVGIANDSEFGLTGSVWSNDEARAVGIARRLRTGSISINGRLQSPDAPFGGYKQSGLGREAGPEGLAGYQELKAIAGFGPRPS